MKQKKKPTSLTEMQLSGNLIPFLAGQAAPPEQPKPELRELAPGIPDLSPPKPNNYDVQSTGLAGPIKYDHHGNEYAPNQWGAEIEFEMLKEFTWIERIYILFGCNAQIKSSILCRNKPGAIAPAAILKVVDATLKPKPTLSEINEQVKQRLAGALARGKLRIRPRHGESK